jgi:hypothetical protein
MGIPFLFYFQEMSISKLLACTGESKACPIPGFVGPYVLFLLAVLKEKLNKPREALASNPIFVPLKEATTLYCSTTCEDYH